MPPVATESAANVYIFIDGMRVPQSSDALPLEDVPFELTNVEGVAVRTHAHLAVTRHAIQQGSLSVFWLRGSVLGIPGGHGPARPTRFVRR